MLKIEVAKNIQSESGSTDLIFHAEIHEKTIVGIFGNSGQGKSTVFNMIAGIVKPDKGFIEFNDHKWFDSKSALETPIQKRNIGYVFQENSIYPHFTVEQNILYALPKAEHKNLDLANLLEIMGLSMMAKRYPSQLSGGQIQRVAIARTLAQKAKLILMDEPFSGLDMEIKTRLYKQIKLVKEQFDLTVILVTHDVNDIYSLCDEVFWIENHQCTLSQTNKDFKNKMEKRLLEI